MIYKSLSIALLLVASMFNHAFAATNEVSEKVFNLGVLNGQVQGGNMVKVNRTLPDPVIYRRELRENAPGTIIIRDATARTASDGAAIITVQNMLPGGQQNVYVTLNITLYIDSKKTPLNFSSRGEDIVINVPADGEIAELRSDAPAELQVPANYRGNIRVEMQIEDE
ncbi:DUF5462 family protein [Citrobacter sp. Cpo090]|uniref:DUF5462 family protein n=1 Tax=Citrobacter sp. Cpo090 TaxID=2985139 RepID=UPI0025775578|nr:DUF5462 family protein [Citrobacter sp. Cpo090]MDM2845518.1 DUF5462 family protein [Citrobacter sp. Cpo090]